MSYPTIPNFNPGGDDADMIRTIEGAGTTGISSGPNGITDHGEPNEADYAFGSEDSPMSDVEATGLA